MEIEINQGYTYNTINYILSEYEEQEHGEFIIGEHFLVFRDNKESSVVSFVLTGIRGNDSIYKCVYKY